jgi:hypothetical protein
VEEVDRDRLEKETMLEDEEEVGANVKDAERDSVRGTRCSFVDE